MSTDVFASDLDMEVETDGFTADDARPSGSAGSCDKKGDYHVVCNGAKLEAADGKTPCIRLDLEILEGTEKDQIGKMIFHRVYTAKAERDKEGKNIGLLPLTDGGKKMLLRVAAGFGLISPEDVENESRKVRVPWSQVTGRQAVVQIKGEESTDRNGKPRVEYRIPFGNVWPVDHEDVSSVPKDPEALAMLTGGAGIGGGVDVSDI